MNFNDLPNYFNEHWRSISSVAPCSVSELGDFISAHYLRKRPAIVVLALKMIVRSLPVGMVVFALPPRESDKRYGGKTWELARLYLIDEVPRNAETWLIGRSVRYIKRNHRDVTFLLSYADPSVGHTGTIYKAANWKADGMTDDERKSPRCDYVDSRTQQKYGRKGNMPADAVVVRVPRVSKFRFVLALSRVGAELLSRLDEIRARNELMPFDHQTQIDLLRVKRELREVGKSEGIGTGDRHAGNATGAQPPGSLH